MDDALQHKYKDLHLMCLVSNWRRIDISLVPFCEAHCETALQDPDDDMRLPGSSGTDEHQHYVDDGLQQKYEGLHLMRLALNRDLVDMAALITPARAELKYMKLFHRKTSHYSIGIYRDINR